MDAHIATDPKVALMRCSYSMSAVPSSPSSRAWKKICSFRVLEWIFPRISSGSIRIAINSKLWTKAEVYCARFILVSSILDLWRAYPSFAYSLAGQTNARVCWLVIECAMETENVSEPEQNLMPRYCSKKSSTKRARTTTAPCLTSTASTRRWRMQGPSP